MDQLIAGYLPIWSSLTNEASLKAGGTMKISDFRKGLVKAAANET